METRELIAQIGRREPLNPYQVAGMAAVLDRGGSHFGEGTTFEVDRLENVLMVLDRTGAEAAPYLVDVKQTDSKVVLFPKFPAESLEELVYLTSFQGRREAIRENLIPVIYEIPNWLDLVRTLTRYSLERDNEALEGHLSQILEILLNFLCAANLQPFDAQARSEAEYAICRIVESILRSTDENSLSAYLPFVQKAMNFLISNVFPNPSSSFERRVLEVAGIKSALAKRNDGSGRELIREINLMAARALVTALGEIQPCPSDLLANLEQAVAETDFPEKERFYTEILGRIKLHSAEEIESRRQVYTAALENSAQLDEAQISEGIAFISGLAAQWKLILSAFQEFVDALPPKAQEAFSRILAIQILEVDKQEIKDLLIEGICQIVVRLEKTGKRASRDLVDFFATLFLDRAYSSNDTDEVISSLKAIEALGVTLARAKYFLMADVLIEHLVQRPLIFPKETKYTIEDDDTGEPLVVAEEAGITQAHVQHIKSLMAIVAANPRIMHGVIPYLIVQIEIGRTRLCDEDLIQYWISSLLRANSPITHFLIRTLIKAIPYSFKDIGPLDTLRLTAAGLAKELANRGVKPIGNFLGKLRGDIHWRGSIENFYFCQGIIKYFATGQREAMAEWMPQESMPYLTLDKWCSSEESQGINDLCSRIFADLSIDLADKDGMMALISLETSLYRKNDTWPEFSRRMVLDVIDLLKGLYNKYFVARQATSGSGVVEDLERLDRIIEERKVLKETFLTPDIREPIPPWVTLTEGTEDYVREIERIRKEQPETPIMSRSKKAGHAYAQKATYMEPRFEAFNKDLLSESFQETLATTINNIYFDEITHENLPLALTFVDHLVRGLSVNGHSSYYLLQAGRDLHFAGNLGLTLDKVRDLLKVIKSELDDIHVFYRNWFEGPFDNFLAFCPMERLPRKLKDLTTLKEIPDTDFFQNYLKTLYISDLQARDGNLRVLETFVDKIEGFLNQRLAESGRRVVETTTPAHPPTPFYFPDEPEVSACKIGLKALLLRFAEKTPPYFVITTDQPWKDAEKLLADTAFREGLSQAVEELGKRWRRKLGDPLNPALFSLRSGARISMPGMMTTITNVGINDEIAEGLSKIVDTWFAYDCYRRFLQEFSQSVFGVEREEFQEIIDDSKNRLRIMRKAQMSSEQMKEVAFEYKRRVGELAPKAVELLDNGQFVDILIYCAVAVMRSPESLPARKYKEAARIHGDWRTPVIVQGMVYGNMERDTSGTGVVSYNPFSMDLRGDFALADQGTDVVDGKVPTIPVFDFWRSQETLSSQMPDAWKELSSILFRTAERLSLDTRIEYTIEKGKVYVLQIRKDRERKERVQSLKDFGYPIISQGTGVSGKIFRGIMVTDRNQIAPFRHINKAQSIIDAMNEQLSEREKLDGFIFVVNDPIPEEIMEEIFSLPVNTGLVSRLGGRGAHAADIAKALGRVYVGQVRQITKFAGKPETVTFNDREVIVGTKMIIHGRTGEIALYGPAPEEKNG